MRSSHSSEDGFPHRPEVPNAHWLDGEQARRDGKPRSACPWDYSGSQWEWQAGWDYANVVAEASP